MQPDQLVTALELQELEVRLTWTCRCLIKEILIRFHPFSPRPESHLRFTASCLRHISYKMNCKSTFISWKVRHYIRSGVFYCSSHARFLWKRIPQNLKNAELEQLYKVFECLWHNRPAPFYTQVNYNWSPNVGKLVVALKGMLTSHDV